MKYCAEIYRESVYRLFKRYVRRLFTERLRFDGDEKFDPMTQKLFLETLYDIGVAGIWKLSDNKLEQEGVDMIPVAIFPIARSAKDGSIKTMTVVRAIDYKAFTSGETKSYDDIKKKSFKLDVSEVATFVLNTDCLSMDQLINPMLWQYADIMTVIYNNILTSQVKYALKMDPNEASAKSLSEQLLGVTSAIIGTGRGKMGKPILDKSGDLVGPESFIANRLENITLKDTTIAEVVDALKFIKSELQTYAIIRADKRAKAERHITDEFAQDEIAYTLNENETLRFANNFTDQYNKLFEVNIEPVEVGQEIIDEQNELQQDAVNATPEGADKNENN